MVSVQTFLRITGDAVASHNVDDHDVQESIDRAVRNEARLQVIESTVKATSELTGEVRKDLRNIADEIHRHTADDSLRFTSIDSRFVGEQTQLTQILNSIQAVERKVNEDVALIDRLKAEVFDEEGHSRLAPLLLDTSQRQQFWAALKTQWGFVAGGAGFAALVMGGVAAVLKIVGG